MTSEPTPRTLRHWRERQALTQQQLADRLAAFAWDTEGLRVGVDPAMVSKWERGDKGVSSLYRRLLAGFFKTTPDQLGLGRGLTLLPGGRAKDAAVLAPTADGLVLPVAIHPAPPLTVVGRASARGAPRRGPLGVEDLVDALDTTIGILTASYPWAPVDELLPQVVQHLEHLEDLAQRARRTAKLRVVALCGEAALLAGRLVFTDLGQPVAARGHFVVALEAAREGQQPALAAAALGWLGLIPARQLRHRAAMAALRDASRCLDDCDDILTRAWLTSVRGEVLTLTGLPGAALQVLDVAGQLLRREGPRPAPRWLDIGAGRLAGLEGSALVRVGDAEAARSVLEHALEALPPRSLKQKAALLADLASLLSDLGERERAEAVAENAAQILAAVPLAGLAERLRQPR